MTTTDAPKDDTDVDDIEPLPAVSSHLDDLDDLDESRWPPAVAGIVAAGSALATGELLSGLSADIPSLVISVGELIIDKTPGGIARWSIGNLGSNQKPALVVGITVISIALGALFGIASSRRMRTGVIGFSLFGLFGAWAVARNPLAANGPSILAALVAALVGVIVLVVLLRMLRSTASEVEGFAAPEPVERRSFLTAAGGGAALAVGATALGRSGRASQNAEGSRESVAAVLEEAETGSATSGGGAELSIDPNATPVVGLEAEVDGVSTWVTPNDEFYRIDTALTFPQIDVDDWELTITGMVDNPITMNFQDLLDMGLEEEHVTLSCVSNPVGGELVGNAKWLGVPLSAVLERVGVQAGATQIMAKSYDDWTAGFPTEAAFDGRTAMIAVAMNDEPLPVKNGFPARLVVSGLYGYVSATKWLREIKLTTLEAEQGYWIPRGWSKFGPIKTQSRIDVPRRGETLTAGRNAIAGIAWAPNVGITRVEVTTDAGETWQEARLFDEVTDNSWRQWVLEWDAQPGTYVIGVRATDATGETQTPERSRPDPDGATGWDNFQVTVA